jgi:hypothetical protein
MKITSILIIALVVSISTACGQSLDNIVRKIADLNEVQYEHVGIAGQPSENYQNFEKLKEKADIPTLLELTENKNPVVSCYASWALIDKEYSDLATIFSKYLNSDKSVATFSGCIKSEDNLSSEFYHRFWNKTTDKRTNQTLVKLDSLILYNDNPYWLLLTRTLENRVYPKSYNQRIAILAFDKGYKEAIFYLSNWYKAEYNDQLRHALVKYLKNTNFKDVGTTPYYETVAELLKFNDEKIKETVIEKLKKDRHWEYDKEKFKFLLDQYYIYQSDFKK